MAFSLIRKAERAMLPLSPAVTRMALEAALRKAVLPQSGLGPSCDMVLGAAFCTGSMY